MKNKNKKGFTLLELLVVVLIIGILAAVALPQYQRVKEKTIMAEGIQIAKQIAEANMRYYLVNNEYVDDIQNLDIDFGGKREELYDTYRTITDNFTISSTNQSRTYKALVQRNPFNVTYYIYMDRGDSDVVKCRSISGSKIQKELCNKLNADGHL